MLFLVRTTTELRVPGLVGADRQGIEKNLVAGGVPRMRGSSASRLIWVLQLLDGFGEIGRYFMAVASIQCLRRTGPTSRTIGFRGK